MHSLSDATFMRAVYTRGHSTAPNVEAVVNLSTTPVNITLFPHTEPFLQDNYTAGFPPTSGITFAKALDTLRRKLGPDKFAPLQMTFRRPLHPCASEDLFQFNLANDTVTPVVSLGLVSAELCKGFITQRVDMKMCLQPSCWGRRERESSN
mmetsp:Transcript_70106/g.192422  ORF Transcript_70106/g.192422 Transcript_70106/m.192422 type:complete len:151 (+) Transcript_70106:260-712(+)